MSDLLLGILGHCLFHHYLHYWWDFTPCLTWVDHQFSSYIHCFTIIPVIACDSSYLLHPLVLFLCWPISRFDTFFPSSLHTSLSVWFSSLSRCCYHIHIGRPRVHGLRDFLYMLHFIHEGMGFFIIGYLGLVSLHFYHPITLAYVTSRVLRPPWGHAIKCRLR